MPKKLTNCIEKVKKSGKAKNPWAICIASLGPKGSGAIKYSKKAKEWVSTEVRDKLQKAHLHEHTTTKKLEETEMELDKNVPQDWRVIVFQSHSPYNPIAGWTIKNRTEKEAEKEAKKEFLKKYSKEEAEWTLTPIEVPDSEPLLDWQVTVFETQPPYAPIDKWVIKNRSEEEAVAEVSRKFRQEYSSEEAEWTLTPITRKRELDEVSDRNAPQDWKVVVYGQDDLDGEAEPVDDIILRGMTPEQAEDAAIKWIQREFDESEMTHWTIKPLKKKLNERPYSPGMSDQSGSGMIGERFDASKKSSNFREGDRVMFVGQPFIVDMKIGDFEKGTVVKGPGISGRSIYSDPARKMVFVDWDNGEYFAVFKRELERIDDREERTVTEGRGGGRGGGRPGRGLGDCPYRRARIAKGLSKKIAMNENIWTDIDDKKHRCDLYPNSPCLGGRAKYRMFIDYSGGKGTDTDVLNVCSSCKNRIVNDLTHHPEYSYRIETIPQPKKRSYYEAKYETINLADYGVGGGREILAEAKKKVSSGPTSKRKYNYRQETADLKDLFGKHWLTGVDKTTDSISLALDGITYTLTADKIVSSKAPVRNKFPRNLVVGSFNQDTLLLVDVKTGAQVVSVTWKNGKLVCNFSPNAMSINKTRKPYGLVEEDGGAGGAVAGGAPSGSAGAVTTANVGTYQKPISATSKRKYPKTTKASMTESNDLFTSEELREFAGQQAWVAAKRQERPPLPSTKSVKLQPKDVTKFARQQVACDQLPATLTVPEGTPFNAFGVALEKLPAHVKEELAQPDESCPPINTKCNKSYKRMDKDHCELSEN